MAAIGSLARLAVAGIGVAAGLSTLALARRADAASWAGRSAPADALQLVVGWSLLAAGLRLTSGAGGRAAGVLLTAAGLAWFVNDWDNQEASSAVMFTLGLVFSTVSPALVGHALLRYEGRRLGRFDRVAVVGSYVGSAVLGGLAPALFFDPARQGCSACAANLLAWQSNPAVVDRFGAAAVVAGPVWCGLVVFAIGRAFIGAGHGRRLLTGPVLIPGVAYLLTVGAMYLEAFGAEYVPVSAATRRWWPLEGGLLVTVAVGSAWPHLQRRLTRSRVARLVVDIAGAPPVGGLSSLLSRTLGDPSLSVLYRLADGEMVDAAGDPAAPDDRQTITRVVRGGETLALLAHRPGLLNDVGLIGEIGDAARLVLDSERLQAQNRAQLQDLRASRARIVQSGDEERRRLERDLHDGAQQRLVALALALQLAAMQRSANSVGVEGLTQARAEVGRALAELRSLARGIYPRELADEGLAAALETWAEGSAVPVRICSVPERRFTPAVEAAAYHVVADSAKASGASGVRVSATVADECLTIEVEVPAGPLDTGGLEDRVGALGGRLSVDRLASGAATIRAELPCGS